MRMEMLEMVVSTMAMPIRRAIKSFPSCRSSDTFTSG
jgi:hypothetical protein